VSRLISIRADSPLLHKLEANFERKSREKLFRRQTLAPFALQFQNPQRVLSSADHDAGFVRK